MKVLFFVDTHGNDVRLKKLVEKSSDVDLIVCAGDFTVFEDKIVKVLYELNKIGKPVLIIHGNHETASGVRVESAKFENLHCIHKNYHIAGDIVFYGFGGGGFSVRDEVFTRESNIFIEQFKQLSEKNYSVNHKHYRLVLVTHAPPYGTKIDFIGEHVGNQNITEFILKHQPIIAVSGHLHENAGVEDKMNLTRVINPGWDGIIIDL